MEKEKSFYTKVAFIVFAIFLFFLGYALRENAAGGGKEFYNLSWPIVQSLKEDFIYTIKNYGSFKDYSFPLTHIINAFINPFSDSEKSFQLFNTFLSFMVFLVFGYVLKSNFQNSKFTNIWILSSVILFLPFFRTSAFWGKSENFGWLFFLLSIYFFLKVKKNILYNPSKKDLFNVVLFCFLSSCALYARQALMFLPISYLFYLFLYKANKKIIFVSIFSYIIFSIPGILLIMTWGNLFDTKTVDNYFISFVNAKYILKNIPILLSYFGFYLLPILFCELLDSGFKNFIKKYINSFFAAFTFFIILYQFNFLEYLGNYTIGGGAILKLNYLIIKNNYLLFLLIACVGFAAIYNLIKEDPKNNLIILIPLFIIYGFPNLLYQEYVEPLIIFIFFLTLNTSLHKIYFSKISIYNFILLSYFTIYLLGSIYFKHFAFNTLDKWKLFLNM